MAIDEIEKIKLKKLGLRIQNIRNARGLTLLELSYEVDKEPQSISRVEMGKINPSYLYLLKICEGLKADINELLTD
ncbi:helix-turn-helix domain-containing protein [Ferruginibacter sp.]